MFTHHHHHHHLPSITLTTIFIFISTYIPTSHSHNCTNFFHCGENVQQIGYPFYGQDRPSACGLAGFELKCQDSENITTIEIRSQTFKVLKIDQNVRSITLARSDLLDDVCPQRFNATTTMDDILFSYVPGTVQFLNLYYSCPFSVGRQTPDRSRITCSMDGRDTNGYYLNESSWSNDQLRTCDVNVTVPVPRMAVEELISESGNSVTLKGLLEEGFPIEYKFDVEACNRCERSRGLCWSGTNTSTPSCVCSDDEEIQAGACPNSGSGSSNFTFRLKIILGGVALMVGLSIVLIIYCYYKMSSFSKYLAFFGLRPNPGNDAEAFITQYKFSTPRRYKYSEIKRMTNAFKDELGQGGFGSVFKGTLADGSLVAIKVLKESKGNGEEFFNEVASIGRTSHVNIVALKGFCYEGPKRALVYEFMPNGSLDKFIFQNIPKDSEQLYLRVEKLYEIALGIARGLEYLHRGCNTRILHFDIKPHNILLDEELCPKISDFGLAKLHSSKESIMSMVEARGTIGYIAPEVFNRNFGGVSHKSDVYSYGMMVVEMVAGRKNVDVGVVHSSEIYFPEWIYKRLELDEDLQLLQQQQGPVTAVENEIARKMIIVGLWCIQADPSQRPSMNKVIDMLVGSTEALKIPPNPVFSSPPRPSASSSTTLESIST